MIADKNFIFFHLVSTMENQPIPIPPEMYNAITSRGLLEDCFSSPAPWLSLQTRPFHFLLTIISHSLCSGLQRGTLHTDTRKRHSPNTYPLEIFDMPRHDTLEELFPDRMIAGCMVELGNLLVYE